MQVSPPRLALQTEAKVRVKFAPGPLQHTSDGHPASEGRTAKRVRILVQKWGPNQTITKREAKLFEEVLDAPEYAPSIMKIKRKAGLLPKEQKTKTGKAQAGASSKPVEKVRVVSKRTPGAARAARGKTAKAVIISKGAHVQESSPGPTPRPTNRPGSHLSPSPSGTGSPNAKRTRRAGTAGEAVGVRAGPKAVKGAAGITVIAKLRKGTEVGSGAGVTKAGCGQARAPAKLTIKKSKPAGARTGTRQQRKQQKQQPAPAPTPPGRVDRKRTRQVPEEREIVPVAAAPRLRLRGAPAVAPVCQVDKLPASKRARRSSAIAAQPSPAPSASVQTSHGCQSGASTGAAGTVEIVSSRVLSGRGRGRPVAPALPASTHKQVTAPLRTSRKRTTDHAAEVAHAQTAHPGDSGLSGAALPQHVAAETQTQVETPAVVQGIARRGRARGKVVTAAVDQTGAAKGTKRGRTNGGDTAGVQAQDGGVKGTNRGRATRGHASAEAHKQTKNAEATQPLSAGRPKRGAALQREGTGAERPAAKGRTQRVLSPLAYQQAEVQGQVAVQIEVQADSEATSAGSMLPPAPSQPSVAVQRRRGKAHAAPLPVPPTPVSQAVCVTQPVRKIGAGAKPGQKRKGARVSPAAAIPPVLRGRRRGGPAVPISSPTEVAASGQEAPARGRGRPRGFTPMPTGNDQAAIAPDVGEAAGGGTTTLISPGAAAVSLEVAQHLSAVAAGLMPPPRLPAAMRTVHKALPGLVRAGGAGARPANSGRDSNLSDTTAPLGQDDTGSQASASARTGDQHVSQHAVSPVNSHLPSGVLKLAAGNAPGMMLPPRHSTFASTSMAVTQHHSQAAARAASPLLRGSGVEPFGAPSTAATPIGAPAPPSHMPTPPTSMSQAHSASGPQLLVGLPPRHITGPYGYRR